MDIFVFIVFIVLVLISALVVLFTRNVLYAAFSLLLTFLGVAGLFVFARADLPAVAQIMLYVGGILVLIIFGIMLTRSEIRQAQHQKNEIFVDDQNIFKGAIISLVIFGFLAFVLVKGRFNVAEFQHFSPRDIRSTVNDLGILLLTDAVLPFELAGVILLVALLGAAFLLKRN